jgi:hypothetical protein
VTTPTPTPSPRHTDPARVAAFLRCTLAPAGVTLRDDGKRLWIVQPDWAWLQPEVDARAATIRQVWAEWAAEDGKGQEAQP